MALCANLFWSADRVPPLPPHGKPPVAASDPDGSDGGFHRLKAADVQAAAVIRADEARAAYRAFVEHQLEKYSNQEFILFDTEVDGDGLLITAGRPAAKSKEESAKEIRLSSGQLAALKSGVSGGAADALKDLLPQSHSTALVAYSNPFIARGGDYEASARAFAFQLQKAEADVRVYRDPLSASTAGNVRHKETAHPGWHSYRLWRPHAHPSSKITQKRHCHFRSFRCTACRVYRFNWQGGRI
jgi:hypothetical protein